MKNINTADQGFFLIFKAVISKISIYLLEVKRNHLQSLVSDSLYSMFFLNSVVLLFQFYCLSTTLIIRCSRFEKNGLTDVNKKIIVCVEMK